MSRYSKPLIISEMGVSNDTINIWLERYREFGEEGLKDRPRTGRRKKTTKNFKKKIVSVKKNTPGLRLKTDLSQFWKF